MSMITRRRLVAGVVALAATAGLVACGSSSKKANKTIAIISPYYSSQPATKQVVDAFEADAKAAGYTTTLVDTKGDLAAVNTELQNAVTQKPGAIVLGMGDPKEFSAGLKAAVTANIPVFGLDAGTADGIVANFTSDNDFLGTTSAKALVDGMGGGKGKKVIVINFDPFEPVRLRAAAARTYFKEQGVTVIEDWQGDPADSTGSAKTKILDLLSKYATGEVDGIYAAWDASALGAFQATVQAKRTEVKVVGVDGQDFARAEIKKDSNWVATVKQDWDGIAKTALGDIEAYLTKGTKPESVVKVPGQLITKANA